MSVLWNQIGAEGLNTVIEHLPKQYRNCQLHSQKQRATYVCSLLESKQRPFIWEYLRPGTVEIGEEQYFDEVSFCLP